MSAFQDWEVSDVDAFTRLLMTGASLALGQSQIVSAGQANASHDPPPHSIGVGVQVNVNEEGLNVRGDAANSPSIAIDPTDPNRLVIVWR